MPDNSFKPGKCLEPFCDEKPAENSLFCQEHSDGYVDSDTHLVSNMKAGESGFVSSCFCFYLVHGQVYIGGNFPFVSSEDLVNTIPITMIDDGTIEITIDSFSKINLWIAEIVLKEFLKVNVK